jgi:hypothetical protein
MKKSYNQAGQPDQIVIEMKRSESFVYRAIHVSGG